MQGASNRLAQLCIGGSSHTVACRHATVEGCNRFTPRHDETVSSLKIGTVSPFNRPLRDFTPLVADGAARPRA
jgi:hypothetical protein